MSLPQPIGVVLPSPHGEVLVSLQVAAATWGGKKRGVEKRIGGKAATLGRLALRGVRVPPSVVLEASHFERALAAVVPKSHDTAALIRLANSSVGIDRAARARDRLLRAPLPEAVTRALEALLAFWGPEVAPWGLAVRSSATSEDADATSLAGLATSVIGAQGLRALEDAVRTVWASALLPSTAGYLAQAGVARVAMAVLIQPVVRARAAGVLFTGPPPGLEGEGWPANERLVNATFGLGAPVVEGACAADAFRLAAQGGRVVAQSIALKPKKLVVTKKGLVAVATSEAEGAGSPSLGARDLAELASVADQLERLEGRALDIEFALEREQDHTHARETGRGWDGDERVIVLQARPLTGAGFPDGGDESTVWSRTNVSEALPGPATPLTWSIARAFSDKGFREAFEALGCKPPKGEALVAQVHGRFYLNLSAFMRIAAQVPGLSPRALLLMSGGANEASIRALTREAAGISKRRFVLRAPLSAAALVKRYAGLAGEVDAFDARARAERAALVELDLGLLPDDSLATTLRGAARLLDETGTLMLACASASLATRLSLSVALGALAPAPPGKPKDEGSWWRRRVTALDQHEHAHEREREHAPRAPEGLLAGLTSGLDEVEHLAQVLTGGMRELVSAEPGLVLARVARVARDEPEAAAVITSGKARALGDLPEGPTRRALEAFVEEHGDRAVREAELAQPRWREDLAPVFAMLEAALRSGAPDPDFALARARASADEHFARLESSLGAPQLALLHGLAKSTQHFTRLRERMRAWVTRVLGMLRRVALEIDSRLARLDAEAFPGAVFFCTVDELLRALASGRADVGHVARLRRAQHLRDANRPDPPATFIGRPPPATLPATGGREMRGLPASGGVVEGPARVLEPGGGNLAEVRAGDVLVSRTTDVGLSPLFLVAAGVVTELGGPLSHASIVAREYGLPAVVSVSGATTSIRTGDRLRVDGDRGVVEILPPVGARVSAFPPPMKP